MFELPLFPLNTVLFPGMPISLHIFEPRYKQMISKCLGTGEPFGVVLIRHGAEARDDLATPYHVGCTAKIIQMQRLEEGRMNIVALGRERFRIMAFQHDHPYLTGQVIDYPLVVQDEESLQEAGERLRPWVELYMEMMSSVTDVDFEADYLPEGPLALAFMAAHLVQSSPRRKQEILEEEDALELVTALRELYRREVALTRAITSQNQPEDVGIFSIN